MRYIGVIITLLAICSASFAENSKSAAGVFAGGEPGCLRLVGSRSLSRAQVKLLPAPCGNFHKNYSRAVQLLASEPKAFSAGISKTLSDAEKSGSLKAPYDALLLAVLVSGTTELPAIQAYADFERKKNVYFKYASAAAERLVTGKCKSFDQPVYEEICSAADPILTRLVALNQPIAGHKK